MTRNNHPSSAPVRLESMTAIEVLRLVKEWWLVILGLSVLGAGGGVLSAWMKPKMYRTTAVLNAEYTAPSKDDRPLNERVRSLFSDPACTMQFSQAFFDDLHRTSAQGQNEAVGSKRAYDYFTKIFQVEGEEVVGPVSGFARFLVGPSLRQSVQFPSGFDYKVVGVGSDQYAVEFQGSVEGAGAAVMRSSAQALRDAIGCLREAQVVRIRAIQDKIANEQQQDIPADSPLATVLRGYEARQLSLRMRFFELDAAVSAIEGLTGRQPILTKEGTQAMTSVAADFGEQMQWQEWTETDQLLQRIAIVKRDGKAKAESLDKIVEDIAALGAEREELRRTRAPLVTVMRRGFTNLEADVAQIGAVAEVHMPLPILGERAFPSWRKFDSEILPRATKPYRLAVLGAAFGFGLGVLLSLSVPLFSEAVRHPAPVRAHA